jgi:hypothetical protein
LDDPNNERKFIGVIKRRKIVWDWKGGYGVK